MLVDPRSLALWEPRSLCGVNVLVLVECRVAAVWWWSLALGVIACAHQSPGHGVVRCDFPEVLVGAHERVAGPLCPFLPSWPSECWGQVAFPVSLGSLDP